MKTVLICFYLDDWTEKCIPSLKPDIILDAVPLDSTKSIAQKHQIHYVGERLPSMAHNYNRACQLGFEGDDVVLMVQNDTCDFSGIGELSRVIAAHPEIDVFFGAQFYEGRWGDGYFGAVAIRKAAYERLGPFDPAVVEDWDYSRRFHVYNVGTCTVVGFRFTHWGHGIWKAAPQLQIDEIGSGRIPIRDMKVEVYHKKWAGVPEPKYLPCQEGFGPRHIFIDGEKTTRTSPFT